MPELQLAHPLTDETRVRIEAMGFTWVLPWAHVKDDVRSGFATFVEVADEE